MRGIPTGVAEPARFISTIAENSRLSARYFLMVLSKPEGFPEPTPGSFLHMRVPTTERFYLRRPFSIFDCDEKFITLLLVEKGRGTGILRTLGIGDTVDFLGPLGGAFPFLAGKSILAVSGGVGLAPLYFYRKTCGRIGDGGGLPREYRLIYGARTEEDLFRSMIDLEAEGFLFATEDGSYGFSGNAAQYAEAELRREPADAVFSCGPTPMIKAVAELTSRMGIPHWVSLENRMACAVGACRSCVIPVRGRGDLQARSGPSPIYKTVCKDGPVFRAEEVIWEHLPEP